MSPLHSFRKLWKRTIRRITIYRSVIPKDSFPVSTVGRIDALVNMSGPRLLISSLVIERLKGIKHSSAGQLLGIREDNSLSIVGFCIKSSIKANGVSQDSKEIINEESYRHDIIPHLPANVDAVGEFVVSLNDNVNELEKKFFTKSEPVLLVADLDASTFVAKIRKSDKYEEVDYEVPKETYWQKFIHFRVIGRLATSCEFDYKCGERALTSLRDRISDGLAVKLKGSNICLFEGGTDGPGITDNTPVADLMSHVDQKFHYQDNRTLICELLLKNDSSELDAAPVITHEHGKFKWTNINLAIDALSVVDAKTKMSKLHGIILESVHRNLTLNEFWLLKDMKNSLPDKISVSDILHFLPPQIGHFITMAYPKKMLEEDRKQFRAVFHSLLSLPTDRPFFRSSNEHSFELQVSCKSGKLLSNPHEGLSPSGVVNGTVSLVQGSYDYHHYMQDGVSDNGWGCAYRSLQTVISWFRYQGYYSKPIPSLKDIQKALVSYGDKPESFVGSNKWIGSIEVSYVLESLLGVSSRILRVESGEEMSMKGGELSYHFKTQGSPVMIGGGVLAHTIIGVDYNKKTGDIKFLILDPHYTGEEELSVVQTKGWCGWKGLDFWKKGHFYNMCLPQRPKESSY